MARRVRRSDRGRVDRGAGDLVTVENGNGVRLVTASTFRHVQQGWIIAFVLLAIGTSLAFYFNGQERNDRIHDVATSAASVIAFRCARENVQAAILRQAFADQLYLAQSKYKRGLMEKRDYLFSHRVLADKIRALAPQDCASQVRAIPSQ